MISLTFEPRLQSNFVMKFISRLYIGNSDAIDSKSSKYFTKMKDSIGKVELPDRPTMNDTSAGKLAQTQFLSSTIKVVYLCFTLAYIS